MKEQRNKGNILMTLWNAAGIIIIVGFFVFSMIIGGSAGNGYQENGKYFVGEHGTYVEVSETIWTISSIYESLFWISLLFTPIGAFIISNIQEKSERRKNRVE